MGRHEAVQGLKSQVQGHVPRSFSVSVHYEQLVVKQRGTHGLLQLRTSFDKQRKGSRSFIQLEMLLLTNFKGCFISVATPPLLYSVKAEVSPMLKE